MIIYATTDDLTGGTTPWITGTPPDNLAALLRWASIEVSRACNRDLYTDTPTDQDAAVLSDATCAQVASWVALGVDPAKAGTDFPAPVKKSSILSADVERDTTAQTTAVKDAANGLCDLATAILYSGGLLWLPVPLGDENGTLPSWGQGVTWWENNSPWRDPLSGEITYPGEILGGGTGVLVDDGIDEIIIDGGTP